MNLKKIDLNLLVIFEAVFSAGNISHAAKQLGTSQPAVSNALTRLRELLGDPLFVRGKRGVDPTAKAKQMITPVREALGLIGRQLAVGPDLDLATYKRVFRVLMPDFLEPILMPPVIAETTRRAPGVAIESVQGHPGFADELRNGTLDIACLSYPVNPTEITAVPLGEADVVVIARKHHPGIRGKLDRKTFTSLKHIALTRDLRGLTHVEKDMVASGVSREVVYMVNRIWSIAPMVERSDLVAILPGHFAREVSRNFSIDIYPVPFEASKQYSYLMWHARSEHDIGHQWLRELMLSAFRESEKRIRVTPLSARAQQSKNEPRPKRRALA